MLSHSSLSYCTLQLCFASALDSHPAQAHAPFPCCTPPLPSLSTTVSTLPRRTRAAPHCVHDFFLCLTYYCLTYYYSTVHTSIAVTLVRKKDHNTLVFHRSGNISAPQRALSLPGGGMTPAFRHQKPAAAQRQAHLRTAAGCRPAPSLPPAVPSPSADSLQSQCGRWPPATIALRPPARGGEGSDLGGRSPSSDLMISASKWNVRGGHPRP